MTSLIHLPVCPFLSSRICITQSYSAHDNTHHTAPTLASHSTGPGPRSCHLWPCVHRHAYDSILFVPDRQWLLNFSAATCAQFTHMTHKELYWLLLEVCHVFCCLSCWNSNEAGRSHIVSLVVSCCTTSTACTAII